MLRSVSQTTCCLVAILGICRCSIDRAVPGDTKIGCESEEDCPPDYACKEALGRCVLVQGADDKPPGIENVQIGPSVVGLAGEVVVSFDVTDELIEDPQVLLGTSSRQLFGKGSADGRSYIYAYSPDGSENEAPTPILATMVDISGNEAVDLTVGSISFDFTSPLVSDLTVSKAHARAADPVVVTFRVNETLGATPDVRLGDGTALVEETSQEALVYAFGYSPAGTETEGPVLVAINVVDAAGNTSRSTFPDAFVLDFTPPAVEGTPSTPRPVVRAGQVAAVTFAVSEPLEGALVVELTPQGVGTTLVMGLGEKVGNSYTFTNEVGLADADGTYDASLVVYQDRAGNPGVAGVLASLAIDNKPPAFVVQPQVDRLKVSRILNFNATTVSFSLDESAAWLAVQMGGADIACTETGAAPQVDYDCSYVVQGSDTEGVKAVTVQALDVADNGVFATAPSVTFDFTEPSLNLSVMPPERAARLGEVITLTVTSNESLDVGGAVLDSSPLTMMGPTVSGTSTTWTYTVAPGDQATTPVSVTATDEAGNVTPSPVIGQLDMDGVAPFITGASLSSPRVAPLELFSLSFNASEALAVEPIATFNNGVDAAQSMTIMTAAAGFDYTYEATAPATGAAPFYAITVSVEDLAGNTGTASPATIEIDNVAPELAGLDITPLGAKVGDRVRVTLTANETLQGPPVLEATDGTTVITFTPSDSTPGKFSYLYTCDVTASTVEATYTVEPFTLADAAGNAQGITPAPPVSFSVDSSFPQITVHNVTPGQARDGDAITVTFTADEDLASDPVVMLGEIAMSKSGQVGRDYTYTHTAQQADGDGVRSVSVQMADVAGNQGSEVFAESVELDFVAPSIVSSVASPNPAKLGGEIAYQATVSEPLSNTPALETTPALTWTGPTQDGQTYTWTHTSGAAESATYTAKLDQLCDDVGSGNCDPDVATVGFEIDVDSPQTTARNVSAGPVRNNDTVTVTFTVNEDLASNPVVMLGTIEMGQAAHIGWDYTYTHLAQTGDGDGVRSVSVQMMDESGNQGSEVFATTAEMDFTKPWIVASITSPDPAKLGSLIIYQATVSETLDTAPDLITSPSLTWTGPTLNGQTYTWAHTAGTGETATYTAELDSLCDTVGSGNCDTNVAASGFAIDVGIPTVSNVTVSPERIDESGTVTVTFDTGEDMASGSLEVTVGSYDLTCGAYQAGAKDYECTRNMIGNEIGDGQTIAQVVLIAATDAAGNTGTESGSVVFDFENPAIAFAGVGFTPDPGNPLAVVTKAKEGTLITATAIANEELDDSIAPTMTASNGTDTLTFVTSDNTSSGATFLVIVPAGYSDGTYDPTITWTDVAWNQNTTATFATPAIELLLSTPTLTVQQTQVTYLRSPWGNESDEDLGVFTIPGGPYYALAPADPLANSDTLPSNTFSLGATAIAQIRVWGDGTKSSLLGTSTPNGDSSWPRQTLANLDAPTAYVTGVDEAGNETVSVKLENAQWVATPSPPSFGTSPHELLDISLVEEHIVQDTLFSEEASSEADGADATALLATADPAWREKADGATMPSGRDGSATAYDRARGVLVLFGGVDGSGFLDDTWEWDGTSWSERPPAGSKPSGRYMHAMVYDSARGVVMLFGGDDGAGKQDSWEWDGYAWTETTPSGTKPSARSQHGMAYDSERGVTVVFGGSTTAGFSQETYEWDGSSWTKITPVAAKPDKRMSLDMTFDSTRNVVVLFGGYDGSNFQDTWEWDGTTQTWTDVTPVGSKPTARRNHKMAYDINRDVTVLFAGSDGSSQQDTWEWDGATKTWTEVTLGSGNPPTRSSHSLTYDSASEVVVLFGGTSQKQDTWEWDGTSWMQKSPPDKPDGRTFFAMAYDVDRGVVVLFGAFGLQDTWEWDGKVWSERTPVADIPSARYGHAMVYDTNRDVTVLFGGDYLQDSWEWDGSTSTWTDVTPVGTKPSGRSFHAMAFDSNRNVAVLFGGDDNSGDCNGTGTDSCDDVWEWNGATATWSQRTPTGSSPQPRVRHSLVFDSASSRQVALLFGGTVPVGNCHGGPASLCNDTWEWDGTTSAWTDVTPAGTKPQIRYEQAMAFDSTREVAVLFGGCVGTTPQQDTWEWDGATETWSDRTSVLALPDARCRHAMAYDSTRNVTVMFGGEWAASYQDTWEWDTSANRHPALSFTADMSAAGIPFSSVAELTTRAHCGGEFSPYGAGDIGATLYGWSNGLGGGIPGEWLVLDNNTTGVNASQPYLPVPNGALLTWFTTDPAEIEQYLLERSSSINLQCRPSGQSGSTDQTSQVAMDYVEIRVKYQAP